MHCVRIYPIYRRCQCLHFCLSCIFCMDQIRRAVYTTALVVCQSSRFVGRNGCRCWIIDAIFELKEYKHKPTTLDIHSVLYGPIVGILHTILVEIKSEIFRSVLLIPWCSRILKGIPKSTLQSLWSSSSSYSQLNSSVNQEVKGSWSRIKPKSVGP